MTVLSVIGIVAGPGAAEEAHDGRQRGHGLVGVGDADAEGVRRVVVLLRPQAYQLAVAFLKSRALPSTTGPPRLA